MKILVICTKENQEIINNILNNKDRIVYEEQSNKAIELINNYDYDLIIIYKINILYIVDHYNDKRLINKTIVVDNKLVDIYNHIDKTYHFFNIISEENIKLELPISIKLIINKTKVSVINEANIILKKLGISPNLKGYSYLVMAIDYCYNNPAYLTSINKNVITYIANFNKTNRNNVERSIRNAIEVGWSRCDYEYSNNLFSNCISYEKAKPTNSEFISIITNELLINNALKRSY